MIWQYVVQLSRHVIVMQYVDTQSKKKQKKNNKLNKECLTHFPAKMSLRSWEDFMMWTFNTLYFVNIQHLCFTANTNKEAKTVIGTFAAQSVSRPIAQTVLYCLFLLQSPYFISLFFYFIITCDSSFFCYTLTCESSFLFFTLNSLVNGWICS